MGKKEKYAAAVAAEKQKLEQQVRAERRKEKAYAIHAQADKMDFMLTARRTMKRNAAAVANQQKKLEQQMKEVAEEKKKLENGAKDIAVYAQETKKDATRIAAEKKAVQMDAEDEQMKRDAYEADIAEAKMQEETIDFAGVAQKTPKISKHQHADADRQDDEPSHDGDLVRPFEKDEEEKKDIKK